MFNSQRDLGDALRKIKVTPIQLASNRIG